MWVVFAFLSALFAGLTAVLVKCGVRQTDSTIATAIRTIVVLLMAFLMVLLVGSLPSIIAISAKSWIFLILSGLSTGASWLCYFKALQIGDINKVVPIDKSSTILSVLLAVIFLHETVTWIKEICMVLMAAGTFLMVTKQKSSQTSTKKRWMLYAVLSAVFAGLTSILGKIGIEGVESNLGTMIRTAVVLLMAWMMVFVTGARQRIRHTSKKEIFYICLSGIATGASWLCYYKALQDGPASVVVPIDKLSILVTIAFSYFVFHEKLTVKSTIGLVLVVAGTIGMLF